MDITTSTIVIADKLSVLTNCIDLFDCHCVDV